MSKRKELTVRLENDQYERLRLAVFKLRTTQNQVMREALEMWLAAKQPTGGDFTPS